MSHTHCIENRPCLIHERGCEGVRVIWVSVLFKEDFRTCLPGQTKQVIAWSAVRAISNPNHHRTKSKGTLGRVILGGGSVNIANDSVDCGKLQPFEVPIDSEDRWISDWNCERWKSLTTNFEQGSEPWFD